MHQVSEKHLFPARFPLIKQPPPDLTLKQPFTLHDQLVSTRINYNLSEI